MQCACFCTLEAGHWLPGHTPGTGHDQRQGQRQLLQSLDSGSCFKPLPPTGIAVGSRSCWLIQTTHSRFAQLLLAMSKLWKHFEESGTWLHPAHRSGRSLAGQRFNYSIEQPRIEGNSLSLNAALDPKPLSFRALAAGIIVWNKRGSDTFSPLVLVWMTQDQSCMRRKTWQHRALSLHRSLHHYTASDKTP